MISPGLQARLACPVCLEPGGCPRCTRPASARCACALEYAERVGCDCGGPDKVRLRSEGNALHCPCCTAAYPLRAESGYADLVPLQALGAVTQYADHEFQERLNVRDAPPVLSAGIKAAMMRRMLELGAEDEVLDLGCGAGKFVLYSHDLGARPVGLDISPFFLPRAARQIDLVRGDLRRLPFRKGSFPKAYALDVLEHLAEADLTSLLVEARRVLQPAGSFFVYTHAMESSRLAAFQRAVNRLARRLGRWGLIDSEREALRKGDHVNAIRSHEHFSALCAAAGLAVRQRRYYNVVFKAVVEDLLLRLFERARRSGKPGRPAAAATELPASAAIARRNAPGRGLLWVARGLTAVLELDVILFGRVRTGPFFARIEPVPKAAAKAAIK